MKEINFKNKKVLKGSLFLAAVVLVILGSVFAIGEVRRRRNEALETSKEQTEPQLEETTQERTAETVTQASTEEIMEETTEETMEETMEETVEETVEEAAGETEEVITEMPYIPEVTQPEPETATEPSTKPTVDFVTSLDIAAYTTQLIVVSSSGSSATVSMHQKDENGVWSQTMETLGFVGSGGVGQASEGSTRTPAGVYTLSRAFGIAGNPGCSIGYTQVNDSHYWVDDINSKYYNQFVSTAQVKDADWSSAEHLIDYPTQYAYAVAIDYNTSCTPGAGSAFFLHCSNGNATAGCVSIPQNQMIFVLTHLQSDCRIVIQ